MPDPLQNWRDSYGNSPSGPDLADFVYKYFDANGFSPDEANFALQVAQGESGLDPHANGDGGHSHGTWQLYDQGLLPDFMKWAQQTGNNPDPYDPISTTAYVAGFIRSTNGSGWSNWTAARNLQAQGGGSGGDGRTQFASEQAHDMASTALLGEQIVSERENRRLAELGLGTTLQQLDDDRRKNAEQAAKDKLDLYQTTDALLDARKKFAIQAMIDAAPFMAREGQYKPGFEPSGAAASLGATLGTNVPFQVLPTQKLPLNEMQNAPVLASQGAIDSGMDPYQGLGPEVPGLRQALLSGMGGLGQGTAPSFTGQASYSGGGGSGNSFGGPTTYQPAQSFKPQIKTEAIVAHGLPPGARQPAAKPVGPGAAALARHSLSGGFGKRRKK